MSTAAPRRITARLLRGRGWPIAVLVAVLVGLGGAGTATGMALGAVGGASSAHVGHGHHHGGDDGDFGPGRVPGQQAPR
jgi:hypothetical protein